MVLLAVAVFATAGCTAQGGPNTLSTSSGLTSPSATASASPMSELPGPSSPAAGTGGATEASPDGAPDTQEQEPEAAPVPTFAPAEEQYLASRVPQGIDPNAVLQVGQEVCARLEAVKATDPKAVVSQLMEEKDADSIAAIANLCPGLQPELDAAGRAFTDGAYTVDPAATATAAATDGGSGAIPPGTYEAWNPSPTCLLIAYDADGVNVAESNGTSAVTIPARATRVESDGCYTWLAT